MYKAIFKTNETADSEILYQEFERELTDQLRIVYPKLDAWTGVCVYDKKDKNELHHLPELSKLLNRIGLQHVTGVFFFKLKKDTIQHRHRDMYGNLLFGCSRIHIALRTNPKAFLDVEKIKYHIPPNELWCLDTSGLHAAINQGDEDRVHLVIDVVKAPETMKFFPEMTWEVRLHLCKFVMVMGWKIVRDTLSKPGSVLRRLKGLYYLFRAPQPANGA